MTRALKPTWMHVSRKRAATATRLRAEENPRRRAPRLPKHPDGLDWTPGARRWWKAVWSAPLATVYFRSDEPALFRLAILVDQYERKPSKSLAEEILALEREFGLTPKSRWLLEAEHLRRPPGR